MKKSNFILLNTVLGMFVYINIALYRQYSLLAHRLYDIKQCSVIQKKNVDHALNISQEHQDRILTRHQNFSHVIRKTARIHHISDVRLKQWPYSKKSDSTSKAVLKKSYVYIEFFAFTEDALWNFLGSIHNHQNFDVLYRLLSIKKVYNKKTKKYLLKGVTYFSCYELDANKRSS